MNVVVPIVGYEILAGQTQLCERILQQISDMGLNGMLIDSGSAVNIHEADPTLTEVPFLVNVQDNSTESRSRQDIVGPIRKKFKTAAFIDILFTEIPAEIYSLFNSHSLWRTAKPSDRIEKAIRSIYKLFADPNLSVTQLAVTACMCRSKFEGLFKKEIGKSVWQFVINLRIHEAKRLLVESELTVGEIALHVGYVDIPTFHKLFKKKTGYAPLSIRKMTAFTM